MFMTGKITYLMSGKVFYKPLLMDDCKKVGVQAHLAFDYTVSTTVFPVGFLLLFLNGEMDGGVAGWTDTKLNGREGATEKILERQAAAAK